MVKVKGPCFSVDASGTLAGGIIFQKSMGKNVVKKSSFIVYENSYLRNIQTSLLSYCVNLWHSLLWQTVDQWNNFTDYKGLHGYHAFMRLNMKRLSSMEAEFESPPYWGFCVVGNHIVGEFYSGGARLFPW